jgi:hypothetical protein
MPLLFKEVAMATAAKTYSLDVDLINYISALAQRLNAKQSQIIKAAVLAYGASLDDGKDDENEAEYRSEFVRKCVDNLEAFKRGESKIYTQADAEALLYV